MSLRLDWCSYEAAKYACEKWHYSKCVPKSKLVKIGVWENEIFIGCVIFGVGATHDLVKQYGLDAIEGCELVRVALNKHEYPVTKIISISIKMLKRANPGLKLIVSFADPEQNHMGIIYQAGNWVFNGTSSASDEYIYKGKRWQGRSFRHKYKGMEHHPAVKIVKGSSKYRYLYPLTDDMRSKIEPLRKPYPKRASVVHTVEQPANQQGEGGSIPTLTHTATGKEPVRVE